MLQDLKEQWEQEKQLADVHFNRGNKDAAKIHDDAADALDKQILDLMCPEKE